MRIRESFGMLAVAAGILMAGCSAPPRVHDKVQCSITFKNVEDPKEQERIDSLIRSIAMGEVATKSGESSLEYTFVTDDLNKLNSLHPSLLYLDPSARKSKLRQVLNPGVPTFTMDYAGAGLGGSIEVTVRFRVTPGAQLFFTHGDGEEKDITALADKDGNVVLKTKIMPKQEFIYARTVVGEVKKYIRINIFTQETTDIGRRDYP